MAKTKAKWLNRDIADPDCVCAGSLPFDGILTIKDKIDLIELGVAKPASTAPNPEMLLPNEYIVWFDPAASALKIIHKDTSGVVRSGLMTALSAEV